MTAEIAGWLMVVVLLLLSVLVRARRGPPSPGVSVLASGLRGTRSAGRTSVAVTAWKDWQEAVR